MIRWERKGPKLMDLKSIQRHLISDPIIYMDIGAAGPLDPPFNSVGEGLMRTIRFEPRDDAVIGKASDRNMVVPVAVSNVKGSRNLYLTKNPKCSSLFPPNDKVLKRYEPKLARDGRELIRKDVVQVDTLDNLLAQGAIEVPDVLKIDTQGSEYEVIEGGRSLLEGVSIVIVETWTEEVYVGIKNDAQVSSLLEGLGFNLLDSVVAARWKFDSSAPLITDQGSVIGYEKIFYRPEPLEGRYVAWASVLDLFGFKSLGFKTVEELVTRGESLLYRFISNSSPIAIGLRACRLMLGRVIRLA